MCVLQTSPSFQVVAEGLKLLDIEIYLHHSAITCRASDLHTLTHSLTHIRTHTRFGLYSEAQCESEA